MGDEWETIGRFVRIRRDSRTGAFTVEWDATLAEWADAEDEMRRDVDRAFALIGERFAADQPDAPSTRSE